MTEEYYTMQLVKDDEMTTAVIMAAQQGIDSRLEAVYRSTFEWHVHFTDGSTMPRDAFLIRPDHGGTIIAEKLHCRIHADDMQTFLRRLAEIGNYDCRFPEDMDDETQVEVANAADELAEIIIEQWYEIHMGFGLLEPKEDENDRSNDLS